MSEEVAAPAVEVAPQAQEPSQPTTDVNTEVETPQGEGKPEKTPQELAFEKRIARQTAANRETQRQLQEERAQREAVQKRLAEYEARKPLDDKPSKDDFDNEDDYIDAVADWKINQKAKAAEKKEPNIDEIVEQRLKVKEQETAFRTKEENFRKENPNYDDATVVVNGLMANVNPNHPSTKAFAQVLLTAPNPPALIHYLGTHPAEAVKMLQMNPFEITDALGEIIDNKLAPTAKVNNDPAEIPEALPKPPSAIRGSVKVNKTPEQMTGRELLEKYMPKGR